MGGTSIDKSADPRLQPKQQTPTKTQDEPDSKRLKTTIETDVEANDVSKPEPVQAPDLMDYLAGDESKRKSAEQNGESSCPKKVDTSYLREIIAQRDRQITQLERNNAEVLEKCTSLWNEKAAGAAKMRDAYERVTLLNKEKINREQSLQKRMAELERSLQKRMEEKNELFKQVETLTSENAKLWKDQAESAGKNADLSEENLELVKQVREAEGHIKDLQAQVDSFNAELKQVQTVEAERDELQRQIDAITQCERGENNRKRGRSKSREPPGAGSDRGRWSGSYRNGGYNEHDGNCSEAKWSGPAVAHDYWEWGGYEGRDYRPHGRHDVYHHEPRGPYAPYPETQDPNRLPTSRETPDAGSLNDDFPNMGRKNDSPMEQPRLPAGVPTGPKAGVNFSMREANKKGGQSQKRSKSSSRWCG